MSPEHIKVRYQRTTPFATLPRKQTPDSAAFDAYACLIDGDEIASGGRDIQIYRKGMDDLHEIVYDTENGLRLNPGDRALIPLGVRFAFDAAFVCDLRPRSGTALKHGITLTNAPGTGDADYRGEYKAIVQNTSHLPFVIHHGDRICQMLFHRRAEVEWEEGDVDTDVTDRGTGGFGSTGR